MAYIVVVHMTPKQPSMMPDLLQRVTSISVSAAEDGKTIERNHAYVIPPCNDISVFKGKIQLLDMVEKGTTLPIGAGDHPDTAEYPNHSLHRPQ